jgi:hypothetical protein
VGGKDDVVLKLETRKTEMTMTNRTMITKIPMIAIRADFFIFHLPWIGSFTQ